MCAQLGAIESLGNRAVAKGDWVLNVRPGHPLHRPESPAFKRWLWTEMQKPGLVLFDLYMAQNGAWVGSNVKVAGPNAEVIAAALRHILEHHHEFRSRLSEAGITPAL